MIYDSSEPEKTQAASPRSICSSASFLWANQTTGALSAKKKRRTSPAFSASALRLAEMPFNMPWDKGIVGMVATEGKLVNLQGPASSAPEVSAFQPKRAEPVSRVKQRWRQKNKGTPGNLPQTWKRGFFLVLLLLNIAQNGGVSSTKRHTCII